ncbi:class I SAM-dependent methyltransferase [Oricola sp.]|uniref:class I SAM-dependent methyltransferase n=1 Tax=Oricola sp. TaxID=1979950 RepID=UPI0025F04856|nr:class I SAM-dependent methyltransferase [Oricola sp.]MCI5076867.1 class I SAM-dependent methyltransferase [Oricola sp.]
MDASVGSGGETALLALQAHAHEVVALARVESEVEPLILFQETVRWMHGLGALGLQAEAVGLGKDDIRQALEPARKIASRSSWIQRLQEWPRGYQGDFETIERLMEGTPNLTLGTVHGCMEYYALNCPAAQQHRNKIDIQSELIADAARRGEALLSLACGGSLDVLRAAELAPLHGARIVLNDIDADALELSGSRLDEKEIAATTVEGNAMKVVKNVGRGEFGLVLAGGLFDYLSDRFVERIVSDCYEKLPDRGRLVFTNILRPNPYRPVIEFLANWELIERTPKDVLDTVGRAGVLKEAVKFTSDRTGLTLVTIITKQSSEVAW